MFASGLSADDAAARRRCSDTSKRDTIPAIKHGLVAQFCGEVRDGMLRASCWVLPQIDNFLEMIVMKAVSRRSVLVGTAGVLAMPAIGHGQSASSPVRFAVDWVWQGNHSIWTYGQDTWPVCGREVQPQLMRGYGSADNLTKLAGGALDMALVDPNLLPKYNRDNPNSQAIATCIVYDAAPSSVVFLKSSGIKTLRILRAAASRSRRATRRGRFSRCSARSTTSMSTRSKRRI